MPTSVKFPHAEVSKIDQDSVLDRIKRISKDDVCTMKTLKNSFGLIPETEENRKDVWRLSQAVAELLGGSRPQVQKESLYVDDGLTVHAFWA